MPVKQTNLKDTNIEINIQCNEIYCLNLQFSRFTELFTKSIHFLSDNTNNSNNKIK